MAPLRTSVHVGGSGCSLWESSGGGARGVGCELRVQGLLGLGKGTKEVTSGEGGGPAVLEWTGDPGDGRLVGGIDRAGAPSFQGRGEERRAGSRCSRLSDA